jgi:hypothetical protein
MDDDATVQQGDLTMPEGAQELLSITNLVKTHINKIALTTETLRRSSEMLNDILENDENLRGLTEKTKEANAAKNKAKQMVLNIPQAKDLSEKMKEAKISLKEMKDALSDYLTEYQRLSGSSEFEDDTGQIHKIVYVAKLVRQ